jgi:UDP-N-acetyl-D-mannosaminuronate dehydrogenase
MKQIIQSIKKRNSIIGIIGLGYVGLPLCNIFLKNKFTVYGFDIDKKKINLLKKKKNIYSKYRK